MLCDDRRSLNCSHMQNITCMQSPCPGEREPTVCRLLSVLQAWRSLSPQAQSWAFRTGEADFEPSREPLKGRLRVGLWCPCLGLGGAEVWQLALAKSVNRDFISWRGVAVIEGRGSTDPRMASELGSIMPVGYGLDAARRLATACDVIVSWSITSVPALLSGLETPPRVVVACHFPAESPWGSGTEEFLSGVDRFVAVSELAVESAPPSIRDRVEVIWNAVDPRRLEVHRDRPEMRASWGVPSKALVAGYLGRLSPEKDPFAMIRLAGGLPDSWHVVVVGEGRERGFLEGELRSKKLDRVHLVGADLAAGDVLNAIDTLVVPSRYESFGLTLAEGLRAGVPVVATRSGLAKLVPGLVREVEVEAGSRALADAVLADREDPEGTRSRVDKARAFAKDRLGLDRFGQEWTDLLIRLSGGKESSVLGLRSSVQCPVH
jgi:glycosyltransferase involved in cell wall biosynthesis